MKKLWYWIKSWFVSQVPAEKVWYRESTGRVFMLFDDQAACATIEQIPGTTKYRWFIEQNGAIRLQDVDHSFTAAQVGVHNAVEALGWEDFDCLKYEVYMSPHDIDRRR